MTFLHFIQKDLNEAAEGAIEEVLRSDPSKYVSHTASSFNVDLTLWHVTALELQNIPLVEGTNYLQAAREKEGMLVLGSGPDMNDGSCRLVYSIIKPSQLSVEPFGAFDTSSLCKKYEALGRCSAVRCFSIFEPSIGINVAVVDHENNDISPGQQTKREGDVFHIVSLPYSSTTVQDFKRSLKERLQGLGLDFSAYHTFSHSTTAGVLTLMTVNLSSIAICHYADFL
ncbi:hypothetical protein C7M61_004485 [Candidozyma pseudohaemuli]|uniref:Uncharacterized protein n=1 Tax=Candidozyma pseudohaemuli TaxID=418784 RepID=A0A2P7YHM0_9ASCO|nr:hypothetical protein C7M61_004485 [[Candida] pseudohaemulonii]PSK35449.1 hypothetical protein C7M61_004485 [[Candida] pseudohaemulonii]